MQQRFTSRTATLALAIATVVAVACTKDSTAVGPSIPDQAKSGATTSPGDSTSSSPTTSAPSAGPVVAVTITPNSVTLPLQPGMFALVARAVDVKGVRVVDPTVDFRSSNSAVVSIGVVLKDSVGINAVGLGTAKIYATVNGHTDSATVTVVTSLPSNPTPPTQPTPGVASFDFSGRIVAQAAGTDTSKTTPVAGALVKLSRIGTVTGDTLSTTIDAGSATTDANGTISFKGLIGGAYAVDITPPAGSNLSPFRSGFAPPHDAVVNFTFKLQPKP